MIAQITEETSKILPWNSRNRQTFKWLMMKWSIRSITLSNWIICRRIWVRTAAKRRQRYRNRPKMMHDLEWIRWPLHGTRETIASTVMELRCMVYVDLRMIPGNRIRGCCHTNRANHLRRSNEDEFVFHPRPR